MPMPEKLQQFQGVDLRPVVAANHARHHDPEFSNVEQRSHTPISRREKASLSTIASRAHPRRARPHRRLDPRQVGALRTCLRRWVRSVKLDVIPPMGCRSPGQTMSRVNATSAPTLRYRRYRRRFDLRWRFITGFSPPPRRILDIGCGRGRTLDQFAWIYAERYGVDMLDQELDSVTYHRVDLDREPLPFPSSHFDVVIMTHVIEHLHHPIPIAREIGRVLIPGLVLHRSPQLDGCDDALDERLGRSHTRATVVSERVR